MNRHRILAPDILAHLQSGLMADGMKVLANLRQLSTLMLPDGALVFSNSVIDAAQAAMRPLYDYVLAESEPFQYENQHLHRDISVFLPERFGRGITELYFWKIFALKDRVDRYISLISFADGTIQSIKIRFDNTPDKQQQGAITEFIQRQLVRTPDQVNFRLLQAPLFRRKALTLALHVPSLTIPASLWLAYSLFSLSYIIPVRDAVAGRS